MSALAVFAALVPVFLLILSGVAAKRWLVPDEDHWIGAERLVYYVLFPALLIHTLARAACGGHGDGALSDVRVGRERGCTSSLPDA